MREGHSLCCAVSMCLQVFERVEVKRERRVYVLAPVAPSAEKKKYFLCMCVFVCVGTSASASVYAHA